MCVCVCGGVKERYSIVTEIKKNVREGRGSWVIIVPEYYSYGWHSFSLVYGLVRGGGDCASMSIPVLHGASIHKW